MRKIKTVTYLIGFQRRYITVYQDLLDSYYYSFCDINTKTNRCILQRSIIQLCSKAEAISFNSYPVCETHYVDAAGNLRSVALNEKD
jgi:hypothetical protein